MKCKEIIEILNRLAPQEYACSWDNPGLIVGREDREIRKIMVALDTTKKAIDHAIEERADLIVTHHPMIFSSLKKVNDQNFTGDKILTLAEHKIATFAMHTNYDIAGGMAEICGEKIQISNPVPFEVTGERDGVPVGIGKVGELPEEMTLKECAEMVKKAFGLSEVMLFGDENRIVKRAAISPGSGRSMITEAEKQHADVLITGDIGHHEGLDGLDMGIGIIDAGHYGLEQVFIEHVREYLEERTQGVEIFSYYEGAPYRVI